MVWWVCRYTQGVELLTNVQSKDSDSEKALRGLRITLLTNQVRDRQIMTYQWFLMHGHDRGWVA